MRFGWRQVKSADVLHRGPPIREALSSGHQPSPIRRRSNSTPSALLLTSMFNILTPNNREQVNGCILTLRLTSSGSLSTLRVDLVRHGALITAGESPALLNRERTRSTE